ncbi:DUF4190 domain-containing protein [Mycetocola lacteus]|uniref:DUF4190 domain-containing protein n=1 Tax=Mycetocola lacteus TaxID=76637 RepID=A0A3L7AJT4_9MICO|nr:DUF4190 domain-containing protein [Mycetocola lacteus]
MGATLPYPQQGGFVYDPMMVRPSEPRGQALSAMIVGIASAVLGGLFGFMVLPGGIVALVLGILALRKRQPRGFALTGIITGSWTILISLGMLGLIIFAVIVGNS